MYHSFSIILYCLCPQVSHSQNSKISFTLFCQDVKLVYTKMVLQTSPIAFIFTSQVCTGIFAVTLPFYSKTIQNMYISTGLLDRQK